MIQKNLKFKILNLKFRSAGQLGFTLIELLIVVSIIAILSTLLMVNFVAVRQRARDAERKSSLRQIQSALEIYRADQGQYPITTSLVNCPQTNPTYFGNSPTCTTTYMQKIPIDPSGSKYYNSGKYYYTSGGSIYYLVACIENTSDKDSQITQTPPSGSPTNCSPPNYYVLQNP